MTSIAVLVAARSDSEWLDGCVASYQYRPDDDTEMVVSVPCIKSGLRDGPRYVVRNHDRGRYGLHESFNMLAAETTADWLLLLCDDMRIVSDCWAETIRAATSTYDPTMPWCFAPPFSNAGPVAHVVSKGWVRRLGCVAKHPVVDCYLSEVAHSAGILKSISGQPILQDAGIGFTVKMFDYSADIPVPSPRDNEGGPSEGAWWDAILLDAARLCGNTIVYTGGTFDLFHAGHAAFLKRARSLGDALVVSLNRDDFVARFK